MSKSIISALDTSLSTLVFTERMQQNVLQRIRQCRIEQAQQQVQNRPMQRYLP